MAGDSSSSVEQIRMCIIARDYKVIKAVDFVSFSSSFLVCLTTSTPCLYSERTTNY